MNDLPMFQLNDMSEVAPSPLSVNRTRDLQADNLRQIQSLRLHNTLNQSTQLLFSTNLIANNPWDLKILLLDLPLRGMICLMCNSNHLISLRHAFCTKSNLTPVISVDSSSIIFPLMTWILLEFYWFHYISHHFTFQAI